MEEGKKNLLGTASISRLLVKFAVPSIIAMLVSALYNIVDQLFIGNSVGELGNAAFLLFVCGSILCLVTELFLAPMLRFFGLPENVLPYAKTYISITAINCLTKGHALDIIKPLYD